MWMGRQWVVMNTSERSAKGNWEQLGKHSLVTGRKDGNRRSRPRAGRAFLVRFWLFLNSSPHGCVRTAIDREKWSKNKHSRLRPRPIRLRTPMRAWALQVALRRAQVLMRCWSSVWGSDGSCCSSSSGG
ncbi:hypothetical protein AG1IA_10237 [Rhizoctonia solani AG-1 IA]|uniref:Uncharacterized protein n=1 Tax=Thanatephorus cucumeris (strain AG1-IA) TaxID=983506 RepID=L8WG29_THACA|nr:hypothetical protein AG1IA_10237 [Rhizoctonia solani AG-1 IA]